MNLKSETLPYLSHPLRGIGGSLKTRPEDFRVEEIPAYEPSGEGEFLFVRIEKTGLNTQEAVHRLAAHCQIRADKVGTAGLKDRESVSIQTICLPATVAEKLDSFADSELKILDSQQHRNKLKTGHLKGNRFSILLREIDKSLDTRAKEIRSLILERGFPNYYGDQRFGHDGETLNQGFELLLGKNPLRKVPFAKRKFLQRLCLSAVQSELFNRCLTRRLRDGLLHQVMLGDLMQVVKTGGPFVVEEKLEEEQQRYERGNTVLTGPMFGPKMKQPTDEPAFREETVLYEAGLTPDDFKRNKKLTQGTRRPYLIRLESLDITREEAGLRFEFELPKGVYATSLLREFMQSG